MSDEAGKLKIRYRGIKDADWLPLESTAAATRWLVLNPEYALSTGDGDYYSWLDDEVGIVRINRMGRAHEVGDLSHEAGDVSKWVPVAIELVDYDE